MERGIIRIISGIVLLILQVISLIGAFFVGNGLQGDLWFYIGYFSPTIIGIILIVFGSRAYRSGICSELILHSKTGKIHTVTKWVCFVFSTLLFVSYLSLTIFSFDLLYLFNAACTLAFSVYTLFYMYKRPSCLFSATLIFMGTAYIYKVITSLYTYILYDFSAYASFVYLCRFALGILYIVVAVKLYKEDFSTRVLRALGWTIFSLELLIRVVLPIAINQSAPFLALLNPDLLFVVLLNLYICVFKINTLPGAPIRILESGQHSTMRPVPNDGWQCVCGRGHPRYETSCICGKSKFDNMNLLNPEEIKREEHPQILFCRKCGKKLIEDSLFCIQCGTEVVKEQAYEL